MRLENDIALAPYTYYKIGGPARYFKHAKTNSDIIETSAWSKTEGIPLLILGAGSNILVADQGFPGLALRIELQSSTIDGERVLADAGMPLAQLVAKTASAGLSGFEWGVGIPGSVGGSVRGNAGCFGGEMKDIIRQVLVYDPENGRERWLKIDECAFGYRASIFKRYPALVILVAEFHLPRGDANHSQELIRQYAAKRAESQAIGSQSAGCIFKNIAWDHPGVVKRRPVLLEKYPELRQFESAPNIPASFLIDQACLKGTRIGKVEISPKHANYFINLGGATASEVVTLIGIAKERVRQKFNLLLEEEIQYVGF